MATGDVGCVMAKVCKGLVACLDCWTSIPWVTVLRKQTWILTQQASARISYASMSIPVESVLLVMLGIVSLLPLSVSNSIVSF